MPPSSALPSSGRPGTVPTGPFPPGFKPITIPDRRRWDDRGRYRPRQAEKPTKTVHFNDSEDHDLARMIEVKAQLEKVRMNELLLRLLRRGFEAERQPRQP